MANKRYSVDLHGKSSTGGHNHQTPSVYASSKKEAKEKVESRVAKYQKQFGLQKSKTKVR